jgi:cell fate regulator YaaT (PSP1 superfamily)
MVAGNESGGGCGDSCGSGEGGSQCGNGLEKIYPTTVIRYGYMNYIGEFKRRNDGVFTCGAKVVVQTDRGIEMGTQVSMTCGGCSKSMDREQVRRYVEASGPDYLRLNAGRILREASTDDVLEEKQLNELSRQRLKICAESIKKHNLPMKLVTCETLLGGDRVIFYFMAEGRVDFRDLVKDLASEFQTRIEMRQIGARDEARLVADYETCGRECCCKNFLKTLKPVSMKMAKLQKATLDPSKVSGRCGRLKCCLRYEHETYEDMDKKLPRLGTRVRTSHGTGTVVDRQVLTGLVQIHADDGQLLTVVEEDVLERGLPRLQQLAGHNNPAPGPSDRGRRDNREVRPRTQEKSPQPQDEPGFNGGGDAERKPNENPGQDPS